jgi:hypothetical protein
MDGAGSWRVGQGHAPLSGWARFRDGHQETWWVLEGRCAVYSPERAQRLVIVTTDPALLPEKTTWYLVTNLPAPGSVREQKSSLQSADEAEIVRLYGLRIWVEQSYKQVKGTLGWAQYQVRSDIAMRRHWTLVLLAFSFCWRSPFAGGHSRAQIRTQTQTWTNPA